MTKITPAQALIILIKNYIENKPKYAFFCQLYLLGINPSSKGPIQDEADLEETGSVVYLEEEDDDPSIVRWDKRENSDFFGDNVLGIANRKDLEDLFRDPVLKDYQISFEETDIDNDPTRRFFETHLAYETLEQSLKTFKGKALENHEKRLANLGGMKYYVDHVIHDILSGQFSKKSISQFQEYADLIDKVQKGIIFQNFSEPARLQLSAFLRIACMGVLSTTVNDNFLPLPIYGSGIFSDSAKGRFPIEDQASTRSDFHLGILKSYMPVPPQDIAYTESKLPFLKASDRSTYNREALWVKDNFARMVHPFVNTISGTLLAQLRNILFMNDCPFLSSSENFKTFLKIFIATLLYSMGGHSLHEYVAVFSLPEVQSAFSTVPGFNQLNLKSLFYTNNATAFDKAIADTIHYNDMILQKDLVHHSLKNPGPVLENKEKAFNPLEKREAMRKFIIALELFQERTEKFTNISRKAQQFVHNTLREIKEDLSQSMSSPEPRDLSASLIFAQERLDGLIRKAKSQFGKNVRFGFQNHSLVPPLETLRSRLDEAIALNLDKGNAPSNRGI